jgi:hypothetical protein
MTNVEKPPFPGINHADFFLAAAFIAMLAQIILVEIIHAARRPEEIADPESGFWHPRTLSTRPDKKKDP